MGSRRGRRHPSGRRRNNNGSPMSSIDGSSRLDLSVGEAFDRALKRPLSAASSSSSLAASTSFSCSSTSSVPALSASASLGNAAHVSWRRGRSWTMIPDIPKSVSRRVDASATLRVVPAARRTMRVKKEEEEEKEKGDESLLAPPRPPPPPQPSFLGLLPVATEVRPSVSWDSASGTSASFSGRLGGIGNGGSGGGGNDCNNSSSSNSNGNASALCSGSQLTLDAAAAWPGLFAVDKRNQSRGGGGSNHKQRNRQQVRPSTPPPPPLLSPSLSLLLLSRPPPLCSLSLSASQAYRAPSYGAFVSRGLRARLEPQHGGGRSNANGGGMGTKTLLEAWATARPVVVGAAAAAGPEACSRALSASLSTDLGTTTQLSVTAEAGSARALAACFAGSGSGNGSRNSCFSEGDSQEKEKKKRITSAIKVTAFTLANHHQQRGSSDKRMQNSGNRNGEQSSTMRPASAYEGSFFNASSSSSSPLSFSPFSSLSQRQQQQQQQQQQQLNLNLRSSPLSCLSSLPLPDGARVEGGLSLEVPRWLAAAPRPPGKRKKNKEGEEVSTTTTKETSSPSSLSLPRLSLRGALCTGGGARGVLRSRSWRAEARLSGIVLGGGGGGGGGREEEEMSFSSSSSSSSFYSRPLDLSVRLGPGNARAALGRGGGQRNSRIELFAEASGNGNGNGSSSSSSSSSVSRSGSGVVGGATTPTPTPATTTTATSTSTPPLPSPRTGSGGLLGSLANLSLASVVGAAASSSSSKYVDSLRFGVAWGVGCGGGNGNGGGGSFSAAAPPWQSGPGGDSVVGPSDAESDARSVDGRLSGCLCAVREKRGRVSVRAWAFVPF
jgi:hypothetical protein